MQTTQSCYSIGVDVPFNLIVLIDNYANFTESCAAGSYKTSSMNECAVCPDNKISTGGAALCTPCEAGQEPNSERTACGKGSERVIQGILFLQARILCR